MSTPIPVGDIQHSPTNPRGRMDEATLAELTASVRLYGVLSPVLVRPSPRPSKASPTPVRKYELVYGHRRFEAARRAGLAEIPADVRELTDEQALEIQIVENKDREDIHPLDEASAFVRLHEQFRHSADDIAARVGKPVQYVRDRMRLLSLVPRAHAHFLAGEILLGHAMVLSRLKPADQERTIEHGLFEDEQLLIHPDEDADDDQGSLKPRTVRELQGWIDQHVKLDVTAPVIAELFPETHSALGQAESEAAKILPITHEYAVPPDAKDGSRVYTSKSWRRADGKLKSKTCEKSVLGIVMVGPGRGESFHVCIDKTCRVHFPEAVKAAAARAKHGSASKSASKAVLREQSAEAKRLRESKLRDLNRQAFSEAIPAITALLIKQLAKTDVKPSGKLADLIVKKVCGYAKPSAHVARGKDAKQFLRFLVFQAIDEEFDEWDAWQTFPKLAKSLGFKLEAAYPKPITELPPVAEEPKKAPKGGKTTRPAPDDDDAAEEGDF